MSRISLVRMRFDCVHKKIRLLDQMVGADVICLQIRVKFLFDDEQSLATHLVQRGHVVTPSLALGDGHGVKVEFHRTYFVHTGEVP